MSPYARTSSLLHESCRTLPPDDVPRTQDDPQICRLREPGPRRGRVSRRELVGPFEQLSGKPFHLVLGQIPVIDVSILVLV